MKHQKQRKRSLALLLAVVMILAVPFGVFAGWDQYQGNDVHNGVIEGTAPITNPTVKSIPLTSSGNGWSGVDTVPLMRVEDGVTYAYVLYNGGSLGGRLAKVKCSGDNPYTVWTKQISGAAGFQLSTPYMDEGTDTIYLGAAGADKYGSVVLNNDITIADGGSGEKTYDNLTLTTASNRVAVGVYLGETTVAGRNSITTSGTAELKLGSKTVNLTLSPTTSNSTTYKMFEEEVRNSNGDLTGYRYYYYINHNINAEAGSGKTLKVKVTLNGGTGTIKYIDMYANKGAIQKITGINSNDENARGVEVTTILGDIDGQINTPIVKHDNNLYFGVSYGGNLYYQVNLGTNPATVKTFTGNSNFYWAGVYTDGTDVYFGGDGGYLYRRSASDFDGSGTVINLADYVSNPGNVRSTIMRHGNFLYFTSQGGYLWKYNLSTGAMLYANIGSTSTSTPAVSDNNVIYLGCYGFGNNSKREVRALKLSNFNSNITKASDNRWKTIYIDNSDNSIGIQSSIIIYKAGTVDYVYFTTNSQNGLGICCSFNKVSNAFSTLWTTNQPNISKTYTLQGMACLNGILTFGNDGNHFIIVK